MIPFRLKDIETGRTYAEEDARYLSPDSGSLTERGGVLRGLLEVEYDFSGARRIVTRESFARIEPHSFSTRRYAELMPLRDPATSLPPMQTGGTPLLEVARLAKMHGLHKPLLMKDDGRNPSASYKDRASELVVARAVEAGIDTIVAASTGNAASALATQAAAAGVRAIVFVPQTAPQGKLVQMLACGATVIRIKGTYDNCVDLSMQASERFGWYNRNTGFNPYTTDGKRTAAFEICEQCSFNPPDVVAVSVGDGNIISGLEKGFRDFHSLGLIDRVPRMFCVQAAGADAIADAFRKHLEIPPVKPGSTSHAESIVVDAPQSGVMALQALRRSGGAVASVSEEAIRAAHVELAREAGIFVEPSCAATWAGVIAAIESGDISKKERICLVLTGNGLKDTASALKWAALPEPVEADLDVVAKVLGKE